MYIAAIMALIIVLSAILVHSIVRMLCSMDKLPVTAENYRGRVIPVIGGMAFIPVMLMASLLLMLIKPDNIRIYGNYLTLVLCTGFTGIVDDLIGAGGPKGLIKHLKSTMNGRLTTGFIKALAGLLVSCIVSLGTASAFEFAINAALIALCTNTLNLFDLRPGRALKLYLLSTLLLLINIHEWIYNVLPALVLFFAALIFLVYDLNEVCMLGDTGANILGSTLGYHIALVLGLELKVPLLGLMILINLAAEKVSFTEIIKRYRLLDYLDNLGRRDSRRK
ncbi:MAG: glycosyltransferase [Pseudomonadota bacterium]